MEALSPKKSIFTSLFVHDDDMEELAKMAGVPIPKSFDACVLIPEGSHIWGDPGPWAFHRVFLLSEIGPILDRFGVKPSPTFKLRFADDLALIAGHIEPLIIRAIRSASW